MTPKIGGYRASTAPRLPRERQQASSSLYAILPDVIEIEWLAREMQQYCASLFICMEDRKGSFFPLSSVSTIIPDRRNNFHPTEAAKSEGGFITV